MNREFLESLGLEKDVIDKVMAEHGKKIQSSIAKITELTSEHEGLKAQLAQRDSDINELQKQTGSADELKSKISELETNYQKETEELQQKLSKTKIDSAVELALTKNKARNGKAVRPFIDFEKLELTDDGLKGLDEQLESIKTENSYLFEESEDPKSKSPHFINGGNPKRNNGSVGAFESISKKYE